MTWADNLNQLAPSDGQRPRGSRYTRACAADRTEIRPPATKPRRPKPYPARPHVPAAQASEAMPRSGREVFSAKSRRRWRPRAAAGGHSPKRACRPRRGPSAAAPLAKPGTRALSPSVLRSAPGSGSPALALALAPPTCLSLSPAKPPSPHVSSARPSAPLHYYVGGVAPTYGYSDPAPGLFCPKEKPRSVWLRGFGVKTLAMTYSRMLDAHYHRRVRVSLPSSEWNRVVPRSYCHQGEGGGSRVVPME